MNPITTRLEQIFTRLPATKGADVDVLVHFLLALLDDVTRLALEFRPDPGLTGLTGAVAVETDGESGVVPGVRRSLFRAVLVRLSALTAGYLDTAVDPYRADGEVKLKVFDSGLKVRVELRNTPDTQHLRRTRTAKKSLAPAGTGSPDAFANGSYQSAILVAAPSG